MPIPTASCSHAAKDDASVSRNPRADRKEAIAEKAAVHIPNWMVGEVNAGGPSPARTRTSAISTGQAIKTKENEIERDLNLK